jgi:hypothetical protein
VLERRALRAVAKRIAERSAIGEERTFWRIVVGDRFGLKQTSRLGCCHAGLVPIAGVRSALTHNQLS